MKHLLSLLLVTSFFLIQCGGSKLEEGDANFNKGEYTQALNNYLAYKKANPDDRSVNPKIALAYMNHGKELFAKTKNIDTFSGNFEKAEKFLDNGFTLPEHQKAYSELLFALASAYKQAKPQNEIQKEQYFNNTLDYLNLALDNDADNYKADSLLSQIYQENFQKMFDNGMEFYKRAQKEKNNPDLFLSAEKYLTKAVKFNPGNKEAEDYLSKTRKQTLGILKSNFPFSFCIPDFKQTKNTLFVDLTGQNFSNEKFTFSFDNLELKSLKGNIYKVNPAKTAELKVALQDGQIIEPRKRIDGQLIFDIDPDVKIEAIIYNISPSEHVIKYFP
ncbi:MAG: DUF4352 domain-containing protein [Calditrichae bacterium]|nr:DUF4352 domain-containing protein [Calditrichota bacterium]MCB9058087.1 DUF4352 domain-containing protein [Calditrichia bacterium]